MPLVSVKLPEDVKARVAQMALNRGVTAHAVMVKAIEEAVERADNYDQFIDDALRARANLSQTGQAYDGGEFAAYLRAKAAGDATAKRPPMQALPKNSAA